MGIFPRNVMRRFSRTVKFSSATAGYHTYSNLSGKEDSKNLRLFVQAAGLYWWASNENLPENTTRLVLGVSTWCSYDMRILDALEEAGPMLLAQNICVEIFEMDEAWHELGDFNKIVPGIGDTQIFTPIVGIWRNGELSEKASGYHGRELMYQFLHTIMGRDMHPTPS